MKKSIILIVLLALGIGVKAQKTDTTKKATSADSLMNSLTGGENKHEPIISAFKATRLIFSPTTETVRKNNLNFLVIHRFGNIGTSTGGFRTYFGLDAVNDVYIGFEYGFTDNFQVMLGRSTIGQIAETQFKWHIVRQTNDGSTPLNISLLGGEGIRPYGHFASFGDRMSYIGEVIISRKFSSAFSFEILPIYVQDNQPFPDVPGNEKGFFSLAGAGRLKVTKHMSLIVDYEHPFSSFRNNSGAFEDPLGFGAEFETGGHVFTLNITNARGISQINTLSDSETSYGRGQFRVGFTISRMFDFSKKKTNKDWN